MYDIVMSLLRRNRDTPSRGRKLRYALRYGLSLIVEIEIPRRGDENDSKAGIIAYFTSVEIEIPRRGDENHFVLFQFCRCFYCRNRDTPKRGRKLLDVNRKHLKPCRNRDTPKKGRKLFYPTTIQETFQ